MGGHPPDSCRYTRSALRSQEVVGVWLNSSRTRATSKRIFRARGSKPNSAPTSLSGPRLSRANEPNSARTAGLPAFVEGGNSIAGYGSTRSHACAEDEGGCCFSIDPDERTFRIRFGVTDRVADRLAEVPVYSRPCCLREPQLQQGSDVRLETRSRTEKAREVGKGRCPLFGVALHQPARTSKVILRNTAKSSALECAAASLRQIGYWNVGSGKRTKVGA